MDLDPKELRGSSEAAPVSVLQNRYFVKTFRPEIGFLAGTFLNEAYTDTTCYGVRASLFMNEFLGFEFQSIQTNIEASDDRKALDNLAYRRIDNEEIVTPVPEINPIKGVTDANVIFAPFYGKLNIVDNFIVYSDVYVSAGASQVKTEFQGDKTAFSAGIGQRFYWKKSVSLRIDFRDRIYSELRSNEKIVKNAYSFDIGMSYFFL